jgi:long-chain acyl-CoA synthetase
MLLELLQENASSRPGEEAVVHGSERVTHAELAARVARLAGGLRGAGIGPGDAVALLLPSDTSFVVSYYAIAALGAVAVPLDRGFKHDELEFCFDRAGVRAVICDDRSAGVCQRIVAGWERPAPVITTSSAHGHGVTLDTLAQSPPADLEGQPPEQPLVNMFSSGSTGRPKRVARTHGQCRAEAALYAGMGIGPRDKILCTVPLFHTYGMGCCMLAAAGTGATLVLLEDPNPFLLRRRRALELIEQEGVTVYPAVPFQLRHLAEAPASADLGSLRLCFSAGAALPPPVFDAFRAKFGVAVRQLYGCTEAGTIAANLDADPAGSRASVGRPVGGIEVRIAGGEVCVKSPALFGGYADADPVRSGSRGFDADGWFHTGDLGRLDAAGRLTITGRTKLLIDVGGYKVDPIEVEDVVVAHPKVESAVVVGADTGVPGEMRVKAVVVAGDELEAQELIAFCRERLANFKVPQVVEFRDEIPRSPLGKVLRKSLV